MLSSFDLLFVLTSVLVMLWGFSRRYRMWRQGRTEEHATDERAGKIRQALLFNLSHHEILQDHYGGIAHLFVFWGFIVPFVIVIIAQFRTTMPLWIARGLSLLLDLLGVLALTGTAMLLVKRYRHDKGPRHQNNARMHIWVLLAILVTGFLSEGGRLSLTGAADALGGLWSPVGAVVSHFVPPSPTLLKLLIRMHFFLALAFLALLPFSTMRHMIAAALSTYYGGRKPGKPIASLSLDEAYLRTRNVEQFTYHQLLSLDACMNCGRCDKGCAPYLSRQPLSPENVVRYMRGRMEDQYSGSGGNNCKNGTLLQERGTAGEEDVWCCTTCMACSELCPASVRPLENIIDLRRTAVLIEGKHYPPEYKQVFRNLEIFGDILGKGKLSKEDWASDANFKRIYQDKKADTLLWIGCMGALYDEKSKDTVIRAAKILEKAGVNFGILGKEELCCGDAARRMGNEFLFQELAKRNISTLKRYGVSEVVAICPHCFNVLHNEYPHFGADFRAKHLTQVINDLIHEGRLEIKTRMNGEFTYHDPCYLGRYNGIYQPPRDILNRALSSGFKEMAHSKRRSLCCGAGGGNFWRKGIAGKRVEELRIEEAALIDANGIVTACPLCRIMFDSAVNQKDLRHQLKVIDIIDVVSQVS